MEGRCAGGEGRSSVQCVGVDGIELRELDTEDREVEDETEDRSEVEDGESRERTLSPGACWRGDVDGQDVEWLAHRF